MVQKLILASSSAVRQELLHKAGIEFKTQAACVDEDMVRDALLEEQSFPRDIADALAEIKARKVSDKNPTSLVIGCDQVLSLEGNILSKPSSRADARSQLKLMRGKQHELLSAVVICEAGKSIWRHVGIALMTMRDVSDSYLEDYVERNWDSIQHSVGAYKLEEEGVRLFKQITGDYFTILGLPLLELLSYLNSHGDVEK